MPSNRRHFLKQSAYLAAGLASAPVFASNQAQNNLSMGERSLKLYNIHTGEQINVPFCIEGQYLSEGIQALDILLRDHRSDQSCAIHYALYEKMHYLQQLFSSQEPLYIISGYRSPRSNESLSSHSNAVAENSLHMQGKAVDIRIPGVSHRHLHKAALAMQSGGVGYYPKDGFIHIDIGRTRQWRS